MQAHQEVRLSRIVHTVRQTTPPSLKFNYELFNCNNFNIRYWSWNYRGCWPLFVNSNKTGCPVKSKSVSLCVMGAIADSHPFEWEWHVP